MVLDDLRTKPTVILGHLQRKMNFSNELKKPTNFKNKYKYACIFFLQFITKGKITFTDFCFFVSKHTTCITTNR